jgi:signal peptidase I
MKYILSYLVVFLLGFLSCAFAISFDYGTEIPFGVQAKNDVNSPSDWIQEKDILVYPDRIVIKINDASLSRYAPTGSMKPLFDQGANGIRIVPSSHEEIKEGDIVSFTKGNHLIVHRVIEKGEDEEGIYFITKGDNNRYNDGKIRFEDIKYITIAIIW